jgi:UDP-N-acetylmuramate--alanine ligase
MPAAAMNKTASLPATFHRPHFSGLAGTGMSALAEWMLRSGYAISGSDRSFDRELEFGKREHFEKLGAQLSPQDGSGLKQATCLVVSTAIEKTNPEVAAAQAQQIPIVHRADLLAAIAATHQTIAVSGTSGKSTVTGMTFHVLEAGGLKPSLISGANLPSITERGMLGNAWAGEGEWLVMEADESDGTLVRYHPRIGLILNIEKDHKEIRELIPLFQTFIEQTTGEVIFGNDDPEARTLQRKTDPAFHRNGISWQGRELVLSNVQWEDWKTRFTLDGIDFELPLPGRHNVANALAAIAAGLAAGVTLSQAAQGLAAFAGVERRHVHVADIAGITIVDDFAHNPAKVKACLSALKSLGGKRRVIGIFHPHGFAPMKLVGRDIMDEVAHVLGPQDVFLVPDIYYAGGTADTSIHSADLVAHLNSLKPIGLASGTKQKTLEQVAQLAKTGDIVVSMGARDPGLGAFAANLAANLREKFASKAP